MSNNIQSTSETLKKKTLDVMTKMLSFVKQYPKVELPNPSNEFIIAKDLMAKGEFNLAVCGKVKNGKSSLINALIGRELLPVSTDVATLRVFKISNAEEDSFFVVYANGDKQQIKEEQLAAFGSQTVIDTKGQVETDKTIAFIQVNTKLDFLPKGVSIIDTPGIGSTYPQHTAITKQYIKMADAALFVANPSPLENIEIKFLKEIVQITPGIMFVTTKIDENGNESVDEAISRNVKLINKEIGNELYFGVNMQKMSSKLLLEAAQAKDNDAADFNYEISGFDEVKHEMINLVFLTLGYYRAGMAYNAAVSYYQTVLKTLQNRKSGIAKAITQYDAMVKKYENARKVFAEKMGESKRKEVLNEVELILKTMESDFNQIFSLKGKFAENYENEIDNLSSEEITLYSDKLGDKLLSEIQQEWNDLTDMAQQKMGTVLCKYNKECQMAIPEGIAISISDDKVADPNIQNVSMREKVASVRSEMLMGTALTGAIGTIIGSANFFWPALVAPTLPVVAPVLVVLGVGVILWGAISGSQKATQEKLKKNKTQLKKYVQDTILNCRKQLVETSLADNKYQSLYQGFILAVRQQALESVTSTYDKYKKELDAMKKAITDSKQDPQVATAIDFLIQKWQENKADMQEIHSLLESIKVD